MLVLRPVCWVVYWNDSWVGHHWCEKRPVGRGNHNSHGCRNDTGPVFWGADFFKDKIPDGSNSTFYNMTYYVCILIYIHIFLIWLATYIQLSTFILIPFLYKLSMLMEITQKNLFFLWLVSRKEFVFSCCVFVTWAIDDGFGSPEYLWHLEVHVTGMLLFKKGCC